MHACPVTLGEEEASLWLISLCSTRPARSSAAICRQWKNPNIHLDLNIPLFLCTYTIQPSALAKRLARTLAALLKLRTTLHLIKPAVFCLMNPQVSVGIQKHRVCVQGLGFMSLSEIASSLTVAKCKWMWSRFIISSRMTVSSPLI